MDVCGPGELRHGPCVELDCTGKKENLADGYFRRAVTSQQKKHPGKENDRVAIRKLPAPGVAMTPEDERQDSNRRPCGHLVSAAPAKKQAKKRTGKED